MKDIKKFRIPKKTVFWSVLAVVLSSTMYVVCLTTITKLQSVSAVAIPYVYYVLRDISLVISTILLTAILTGLLIEVRTKNDIYADAVLQDVVANPVFYKEFSHQTKQAMLYELERELLFSNNASILEMYGSIKRKLSTVNKDGYYFSECNYHVVCSIQDDIITKEINRTIRLRSYDPQYTIQDLTVLNWTGPNHPDSDHFQLISIQYNSVTTTNYEIVDVEPPSDVDSFCGYSISHQCKFTQEIELSSDADTRISVCYVTRVPISDNIYTCRSSVPCKNFSVDVFLENTPNYKLNAVAFGFLDSAKHSPATITDREVRISFDDWVFNKDGVSIVFAPRD